MEILYLQRKVTIKDSEVNVDVVDCKRNPRLYDKPMVYGICITSGYTTPSYLKRKTRIN
jgi:hypothetical protein